jgi:hypothetical protein
MRRLEIIQIRHGGTAPAELMDEVRRTAKQVAHLAEVRLYRHSVWITDHCVHLHLDTDPNDPQVSEFGMRVAEALREHGMVEHTVWLEEWAEGNEATS